MAVPGRELYRSYDEIGCIRVTEDGDKRYLAFGDNDEQSCWLKTEPLLPQHEYNRVMLLALLFITPKHCTTLGLGSGSLNHCLHVHLPELKQQVVELRQGVIDITYQYFQFPRSKRLKVFTMDAFEFLSEAPNDRKIKKSDILFSDIYSAEGLDEKQLSLEYLQRCHRQLKNNGWLVLNCWREHQTESLLESLQDLFQDVRSCTTASGNWLIFAGRHYDNQSTKQLKTKARGLNHQLGFPLNSYLNKLKKHT